MFGPTKFFILTMFLYVIISSATAFAHGAGGGEDKTVDDYIIDFGYNKESPATDELLLMNFELLNEIADEFVEFDSAQIRISDGNDGLIFRGKINPDIPGRITLVFTFTQEDIYTLELKFLDEKKTIAETSFELVIGDPKSSFFSSITTFFNKIFKSSVEPEPIENTISVFYNSVEEHVVEGMKVCANGGNDCYFDLAADLSTNYETEDIIGALGKTENIPQVFSQCHQLTHYLARNDFKESRSISDSYSTCTSVCWGGCYHGVMEQYFDEKDIPLYTSDSSEISEQVIHACGKQGDYDNPRIFFECIHGIGHAMMFITDGDLPYSLLLCDSLEDRSQRETCYGGVFMESSSSSTSHPSKFIKEDDPMYPCNILDEHFLKTCYTYQSSHFARINNFNWTKVGILCSKVPKQYQQGCFEVIGSNQIGSYINPKKFLETCNIFGNKDYRQSCYYGILSGLAGRYKEEPQRIIDFCNLVSEDEKPFCFNTMGRMMRQWSNNPNNFQSVCNSLEEHSDICLKGLNSVDYRPPLILQKVTDND